MRAGVGEGIEIASFVLGIVGAAGAIPVFWSVAASTRKRFAEKHRILRQRHSDWTYGRNAMNDATVFVNVSGQILRAVSVDLHGTQFDVEPGDSVVLKTG